MHQGQRVSLNAIRVFAAVARTGSLTAAASEFGVTPGAISHQLRKLEDDLGVKFFRRGHNTVSLTETGTRFYEDVAPSIGQIERAANLIYRGENEITVHATTSLALRWLIPSLERFHVIHPDVRVRVETTSSRSAIVGPDVDVSIRHFRFDHDVADWNLLATDVRRPVIAPALLRRSAIENGNFTRQVALLQCCIGNWDWELWAKAAHIDTAQLSYGNAFDTDDAAIHGSVASLGIVLAPTVLTSREMASGVLVELANQPTIEAGTYRYRHRADSLMVERFCRWLVSEMSTLVGW